MIAEPRQQAKIFTDPVHRVEPERDTRFQSLQRAQVRQATPAAQQGGGLVEQHLIDPTLAHQRSVSQ